MTRPESRTSRGRRYLSIAAAIAVAVLGGGGAAEAQDSELRTNIYYENDTHYRFEDATGDTVGLSKFRNTIQAEFDKGIGGWGWHTTLRGTWDGVYQFNDDQFGKHAGGAIDLQTTTPGGSVAVPHGGGLNQAAAAAAGLPDNTFGFNSTSAGAPRYSPNSGLRVLGDRWHSTDSGLGLGVPVRPCNVDSRGCTNFGGYGDLNESELEFPEFNSRLDFLREFYVTNSLPLGGDDQLFLKLGKQQVVWGRTDLFRVLDVINPVDYSRNNIYDELQDIRIPMWIVQAEWRMGPTEHLQDSNLQLIWNVDKFRPNNLGQCGSPNAILDASCLFRGLKTLWDNGGTVSNFANVANGTYLATDFGPGQIGLRDVDLPKWSLENTQVGLKFEGVTAGGISFSLNGLHYRSQLPSLHGGKGAQNPFNGLSQADWPYLIAFDMKYPVVNLVGGSADFQIEPLKAAVRIEAAVTEGEEFANTTKSELYSENKVFRSVIGIDRPTFIPFISTSRTTLISGQLFFQHIFDHDLEHGPLGDIGMPDWENNVTATLLIKAFLSNDRLSPQLLSAYDAKAHALVLGPSVEYIFTDHLKVSVGGNFKMIDGTGRYDFDDCRSCNPFAPYSSGTYPGDPTQPGSRGLGGIEPLGRFRAGPIGAAQKEDEVFMNLRYSF